LSAIHFIPSFFFLLGIVFMFLTVLSAPASARVKITLPKQKYGVQEVIPARVENRGTNPVTVCVEFGHLSSKGQGLESTPLPFWVEQNSGGEWHTLLIGPDVGSSRHAMELDSGKSLDFPFTLTTTGTLRLQLQYWPGSRPQLDCTNPPKGVKRVRSISFSVQ
jgi:hypothetical protein